MTRRSLLVAVVDDEESIRKALKRLLRSAGMDTEAFASGRDFLDYVKNLGQSRKPDCLVLDLHLPGLTGKDVQRCMKQAGFSLPTIVITGHDQPGVREELLGTGAAA